MVLADLGRRINSAFTELSRVPIVDDKAVDALLRTVTAALLESDVNVKLVGQLRDNVRTDVRQQLNDPEKGQKLNEIQRKNLVQKAVYDHLVKLVDPGQEPFRPKKGKPNVIMFVGLQGSGKTTSCTKLALYYSKRGFKTGLVCADTFRAGAFDQLKQNATKANIPFYGSYTEADPVVIASEGVANFKANRFEVIIVDTSGRHKQESELFNEMVEIQDAVTPDQTIMVLDASIGQAAENQSRAFKEAAGFGAIFLTKIDGHAKGGGAISAVAATQTPIIFIGVGEHVTDIETFRPGPFISKMLGMGDLSGLMETAQEMAAINPQGQEDMIKKITEGGTFTIRDWRNQIGNIMGMGPISKLAGMIPGMGQMLGGGGGEEASAKMKRMLFITDSMTPEELDSDGRMFIAPIRDPIAEAAAEKEAEEEKALALAKPPAEGEAMKKKKKKQTPMRLTARARRVARGSGTSVGEVEEFLVQYRMISKMVKKMGGIGGFMNQMKGGQAGRGAPGGGMPNLTPEMRQQAMAMQNALPPEIKAQLRQPGGREKLMQQMQSGQMPPGMENIMGGMGGGGFPGMGGGFPGMGGGGFPGMGGPGGGGMPDMAQLQSMMSSMGGMGGMANMMKNFMGGAGAAPGGASR